MQARLLFNLCSINFLLSFHYLYSSQCGLCLLHHRLIQEQQGRYCFLCTHLFLYLLSNMFLVKAFRLVLGVTNGLGWYTGSVIPKKTKHSWLRLRRHWGCWGGLESSLQGRKLRSVILLVLRVLDEIIVWNQSPGQTDSQNRRKFPTCVQLAFRFANHLRGLSWSSNSCASLFYMVMLITSAVIILVRCLSWCLCCSSSIEQFWW